LQVLSYRHNFFRCAQQLVSQSASCINNWYQSIKVVKEGRYIEDRNFCGQVRGQKIQWQSKL